MFHISRSFPKFGMFQIYTPVEGFQMISNDEYLVPCSMYL